MDTKRKTLCKRRYFSIKIIKNEARRTRKTQAHSVGGGTKKVTIFDCISQVCKLGGSFDMTPEGKLKATLPENMPAGLHNYMRAHREEIIQALRPQTMSIRSMRAADHLVALLYLKLIKIICVEKNAPMWLCGTWLWLMRTQSQRRC